MGVLRIGNCGNCDWFYPMFDENIPCDKGYCSNGKSKKRGRIVKKCGKCKHFEKEE